MEQRIVRNLPLNVDAEGRSCIHIAVISWKIATCHFDPHLVSGLKYLRRSPHVDLTNYMTEKSEQQEKHGSLHGGRQVARRASRRGYDRQRGRR
jgi:hypothetical protein